MAKLVLHDLLFSFFLACLLDFPVKAIIRNLLASCKVMTLMLTLMLSHYGQGEPKV